MTPYYSDDYVTLYHADNRDVLPELGRFDLLLTDPPYGISLERNQPGHTPISAIIGDENTEAVEWLFTKIKCADSACIFGANKFPQLLPHRGRWICWDKRLTENADRMLGSAFELAWTSRTSGYDAMFRVLHGGVVNANGRGPRLHATEKPIPLLSRILRELYADCMTILDPFAGSCTTGRAAKDLGRKCVLIEREERYCEIGAKRLMQEAIRFDAPEPKPETQEMFT